MQILKQFRPVIDDDEVSIVVSSRRVKCLQTSQWTCWLNSGTISNFVLHFYVLHFHVLQFGPSFSRPVFSVSQSTCCYLMQKYCSQRWLLWVHQNVIKPRNLKTKFCTLLRGVCVCGQIIGSVQGKNIIIIYSQQQHSNTAATIKTV